MKRWLKAGAGMAALMLCAGAAAAAPRGWSSDYQSALAAGRASGKHVLIAIVDTENCYASRAFKRNVVDNEGWADWREGNAESLLLVWWDRAEIAQRAWADVAFLFVPGGDEPSLTTPLVAVLSPDGMRAGPVLDNAEGELLEFDAFTSAVDERLEEWGDVPSGALVWPAVTSASGLRARWSLDYQGSLDKGFAKQWPVLMAIVDSEGASATTEAWVRGVLMTEAWQEWLDASNILLVWWDRAKISRSKWDDVAFRFQDGDGGIALPQIVLFDPDGLKVDQFLAAKNGEENLARVEDFIVRLEDAMEWDGLQIGPGRVGFTEKEQTVSAVTNAVTVTVRRSGGASEGAQSFRVFTVSTNELDAAVAGVNYQVVNTQVIWVAGESGAKPITISLLGGADGASSSLTQRVFHVMLEKASATAAVGISDHKVTINYAPGTVGFTTNALTVYAGSSNVEVAVRRYGGTVGEQRVGLRTAVVPNGAAHGGEYYDKVETNLVWASGEQGEKRVQVPLKGAALDWRSALTQSVFYVALSQATNATASIGITNLTVTVRGSVARTGDWAYDGTYLWAVGTNADSRASVLTWTARQGGWLTFAWQKVAGAGSLTMSFPGAPDVVSNTVAYELTNRLAVAEGSNVVWAVTNCTAAVKLLDWTPALTQWIAPAPGAVLDRTNVYAVSWTVQSGVTSHLYYGRSTVLQKANASFGAVSNAWNLPDPNPSPGVVYWQVEMEIQGDSQTVAQVAGPVWSFSIPARQGPPAPATLAVSPKASPNVVLYQYVPARISMEARTEAVRGPRRYTAKGLPHGLKIDSSTGDISGTPKRAGSFVATVKVSDAGTVSAVELTLEILPCPAFALGEFQGMLLDDAGRVRGALALKVSKTGTLSAKVESGGKSQSLRGAWVDGAEQARTISLKAGRAEVMEMSLTPEGAEGVTGEGWRVLARQVLPLQEAEQVAGYYTAVLRADAAGTPGVPAGHGYVTYTVTPRTRSVKYSGILADGTRVSGSSKVMPGDNKGTVIFPLYKGLYARRGEVSGLASIMPDGGVALGQGVWANPGTGASRQGSRTPFDAALTGTGAVYAQPAAWSVLDGAWLTANGHPFAAVSAAGVKPVVQTEGVTFSIATRTGLFAGRFMDVDNAVRTFKGVFIPALLYGAGFYCCPDDGTGASPCSLPVELEALDGAARSPLGE